MNVLELLDAHGIKYSRQGKDVRSGFVGLHCKFCNHAGEYLGVNIAKGFGTCWSCGPHSLADILAAYANLPLRQAIDAAKGVVRIQAPSRPAGTLKPPAGVGPLLPAHRRYLSGRGFDPDEIAALWGVGGIGIAARFGWSLYIPITRHGEVVSWTTRSTGADPARRYVSAGPGEEAYPAKSCVYGADAARHAIVVVEGPLDAWAVGPGCGATLGVGYSQAQLLVISQFPVRVICFDSEPKAQERAKRLVDDLSPFNGDTYRVQLESAKDPGAASKSEIQSLRDRFLT